MTNGSDGRMRGIDHIIIISGRILLAAIVLVLWQYNPEIFGTNVFWFSRPSLIAAKAISLMHQGELLAPIEVTAAETLTGLGLGCVCGVPIGILLGRSPFLRELFEPFLMVINALPKVALAPLFLVWFGIGFGMKVAVAFSLVFVVMILSTYVGMRTIRQELVYACKVMGGSELQVFSKIVLPSIAPWLFSGFKVSLGFALIGAILGEFIAAQQGVGYMIDNGMGNFDMPAVFLGLLILLALSWLINAGIDALGRYMGLSAGHAVTQIS